MKTDNGRAERVARGAAWLDEHRPGWVDRIDLSTLSMGDRCHCVLGQLDGNYFDAVHALYPDENQLFDLSGEMFAFSHGFLGDRLDRGEEDYRVDPFPGLADAWRDLILARRAEVVQ